VLINSVHDFFPSISQLCRGIADDCGCVVYANTYITPAGVPGFAPHYDDHDVLVLQCYGSKVWSIHDDYEGQRELPLSGFKFDKDANTPGPATHTVTMEVGDVLYIPRGRMHSAATTQSGNSIHLTLSLNWVTWNELIFDLIAKQSLEDVEMRKAIVAHRFGRRKESSNEALKEEMNRLLKRMLSSVNPMESLRDFTESHSSKYFPECPRRLDLL
jgi:ribosomal protein L16 Arg81 hydroxylase